MKNVLRRRNEVLLAVALVAFGISLSGYADDNDSRRGRERGHDRMNKKMSEHGGRAWANKKNARGKRSMLFSRMSDEEKKELAELRKNDKKAFRAKIRELAEKYKKQYAQERKATKALAEKIRNAANEDEKNELSAKLRANLRKQFNSRMELNRKNYEQAAKRLKDLKKRLDAREKNADEIIDRKFKELTEDPDLKW